MLHPIRLATLLLTALLVAGCGSEEPSVTGATEPCPGSFPDEPAAMPADAAAAVSLTEGSTWVCRYDLREGEWTRDGEPEPVGDQSLPDLQEAVDGLVPADPGQMCTMDLGPRYALVTAADDVLTSVVVDDYGCHDARVTSDLVEDPTGSGTLSSGSTDLARLLTRVMAG